MTSVRKMELIYFGSEFVLLFGELSYKKWILYQQGYVHILDNTE